MKDIRKVTRWLCVLYDAYREQCFEAVAVYIDGKPMASIDKDTMRKAITKTRIREKAKG